MTDIYSTLSSDHETQRALLSELDKTQGASDERKELFARLKKEVEAHAAAEEQSFYAELLGMADSRDRARHSVSEHAEASEMLEKLAETDMSSSGWKAQFSKLKEELEHHLDEEEDEVFSEAKSVLNDRTANRLGSEFRTIKEEHLNGA